MANNTSVMGIYPDRTTVSDAVNVLRKAGYRATDIPVLETFRSWIPTIRAPRISGMRNALRPWRARRRERQRGR